MEIDWYYWFLGVGALLVGIVLFGISMLKVTEKFKMKKISQALAVIFLLIGILAVVGISFAPAAQTIVPSATYDVTCAEAEAELTANADTHVINWAIEYNTTSNAFVGTTGAGTFNFTVAWASGAAGAVACSLGANPEVSISGSADIGVVDLNADDSMNALWGKMNSDDTVVVPAYENINLYVDVADSEWARCVITLEATAFAAMTSSNELESWDQQFIVAGEYWTIHYVLYNVVT